MIIICPLTPAKINKKPIMTFNDVDACNVVLNMCRHNQVLAGNVSSSTNSWMQKKQPNIQNMCPQNQHTRTERKTCILKFYIKTKSDLLTHVFLFLLDQTIGICSISNLE
jgi:hypothetical protein